MTKSMNAEAAKKDQKLTQTNRDMYENAKKKVDIIERHVNDKIKYLKKVSYVYTNPETNVKSELGTKVSLLGIKKGGKMIFGTDKIEDK